MLFAGVTSSSVVSPSLVRGGWVAACTRFHHLLRSSEVLAVGHRAVTAPLPQTFFPAGPQCQKRAVFRVEVNGASWVNWETKAWELTNNRGERRTVVMHLR